MDNEQILCEERFEAYRRLTTSVEKGSLEQFNIDFEKSWPGCPDYADLLVEREYNNALVQKVLDDNAAQQRLKGLKKDE